MFYLSQKNAIIKVIISDTFFVLNDNHIILIYYFFKTLNLEFRPSCDSCTADTYNTMVTNTTKEENRSDSLSLGTVPVLGNSSISDTYSEWSIGDLEVSLKNVFIY